MALMWARAMIDAVKGVNLEERTVEGFASTIQPDMIRDVILPTAWRKSLGGWKKRGSMPKFLAYHMHRLLTGHSPVLGPMLKLTVAPREGLRLKGEFAETELGSEHLHLYGIGAMDYFSVGFQIRPGGSTMVPEEVRQLLADHGIRAKVPEDVDRVITEAELLEVSAVVIGANLGALVTASASGSGCCGMCGENGGDKCKTDEERSLRSKYAKLLLERLEKCASIVPDGAGIAGYENQEVLLPEEPEEWKGVWAPGQSSEDRAADALSGENDEVLSTEDLKTIAEAADAKAGRNVADDPENVAARRRIAKEAADLEGIDELVHPKLLPLPELPEDGTVTGEELASAEERLVAATEPEGTVDDPLLETKRVIPFRDFGFVESEATAWDGARERRAASVEDLKKMSAWVDAEHDDTKGAYKLPHHRQSDTKAIWRGVSAAMGALLGARGGTQIPSGERRGTYNHIKKHYAHWDKEAPEFREYTVEELKTLEAEGRILLAETIEQELRACDRETFLAILERVEKLEAKSEIRDESAKSLENLTALLQKTLAGMSGEPGGEEPQTVSPQDGPTGSEAEEGQTSGGDADGTEVLEALLGNLEKLS